MMMMMMMMTIMIMIIIETDHIRSKKLRSSFVYSTDELLGDDHGDLKIACP